MLLAPELLSTVATAMACTATFVASTTACPMTCIITA